MINSTNMPVYNTSAFYFHSISDARDAFEFKTNDYVYSRGNNPTVRQLENVIANLEGGEDAVCFSSGMAAIATTLLSLLSSGDTLLYSYMLYGSTKKLVSNILPLYSIKTIPFDFNLDTKKLKEIVTSNTVKVIYIESPSNPLFETIKIPTISEICKECHIKLVVDNSFMTPIIQTPLLDGADIVIESLSKCISGHGNVVGGSVASNDKQYIHRLKFDYMCQFGGIMSAETADKILMGMSTLRTRLNQEIETTHYICNQLKTLENSIIYRPYLLENSEYTGNTFSIYMSSLTTNQVVRFIDSLNTFRISVSYGSNISTVCYPLVMTHRIYMNDIKVSEKLNKLVRFSIGLENPDFLLADIIKSYQTVKGR